MEDIYRSALSLETLIIPYLRRQVLQLLCIQLNVPFSWYGSWSQKQILPIDGKRRVG